MLLWYTHNILIYNMLYIPNLLSTEYSEGFLSWPGQRAAIMNDGGSKVVSRNSLSILFFVSFFCSFVVWGVNAFRSRWVANWLNYWQSLTISLVCCPLPVHDICYKSHIIFLTASVASSNVRRWQYVENGVYDSVMYHIVVCYMFGFDSSYSMFFHCILIMCYHMVAFYVENTWCCSYFAFCSTIFWSVIFCVCIVNQ